jgi:prepilin-type N-terminal cleavage/methylation domain-containing protein
MRTRGRFGFNFIEIVVVLAILSVFSFLAVPMYEITEIRAREKQLRETLREVRQAIDAYRAERHSIGCPYPPCVASLTEPIPAALLRPGGFPGPFLSRIPHQSFTVREGYFLWDIRDSSGAWHESIERATTGFAPAGVFDLRVPTARMAPWVTAIDGSFYAEW